ncbi:MAG: Xaa-Pro dipeptidyl-peptidase, partial [Aureispira sp.]|nr:Xaa-Pro dipeptidyl-peptidase [Aureispira sp.]
ENGVENDARAWIVRENDTRENPTPYKEYPNPDASHVSLYLKSGAPEKGALVTKKVKNQGVETLVDDFSFSGGALAQAEKSKHRLLYVTPKLSEPIHLSGITTITLKVASSKPAVNLSVWLVSLPWNDAKDAKITDNIITRGWADPQNHSSLTKGTPLTPGKFYELSFDLMPDDQIIAKGQQIGLMIFSSDKEFTLWPNPGTELTIDLGATTISLPIVGGASTLKKALKE